MKTLPCFLIFVSAVWVSGCATVRSSTFPATVLEKYNLHAFTLEPIRDPDWRLDTYNPWRPFVLFVHADLGARLGAWWVPMSAEEVQYSKADTVLDFFREDTLSDLNLSGDHEIKRSGKEEKPLLVKGSSFEVLHVEGISGESKDPLEAWLAYRQTGDASSPQLEVFIYVRPLAPQGQTKALSFDPADYGSILQGFIGGAASASEGTMWTPWKRAGSIYNRFLNRQDKRTVAAERPHLEVLYQSAQKETERAIQADPQRPELYDLQGLLACYNKELEFLGEGFDAASAGQALNKAISLRPNLISAHLHLAEMFRAMGKQEDTLKEYRTLSDISPNASTYYYEQGKLHEKLGRNAEALSAYRQALRFWVGAAGTKKELEERVKGLESQAGTQPG